MNTLVSIIIPTYNRAHLISETLDSILTQTYQNWECIIVDDEPAAHYVLVNYISQNPQLELVQQCYNSIETLNYLRSNKVDLMFLDIDMPEISGLELLRTLTDPPRTILTTAYSEFALESYEFGVFDYLLKPIYFPRFFKSMERFFSAYADEKPKIINQIIMVTTINLFLCTYLSGTENKDEYKQDYLLPQYIVHIPKLSFFK